jgi:hypothetical protein
MGVALAGLGRVWREGPASGSGSGREVTLTLDRGGLGGGTAAAGVVVGGGGGRSVDTEDVLACRASKVCIASIWRSMKSGAVRNSAVFQHWMKL